MNPTSIRRCGRLAALVLALCALGNVAWANPRNEVYVFGDSLSDPHNLYDLTGFWPPSPPNSGNYSNGPVWTEYFSWDLDAPVDSRAVGGAFTGPIALPVAPGFTMAVSNLNSLQNPPFIPNLPGLKEQVDAFLTEHPAGLNPDALYVVWAGANDFFLALSRPELGPQILTGAIQNLAATVCRLGTAGARHFAVGTLPDIGVTPFARSMGEAVSEAISAQIVRFNAGLVATLEGLPQGCAETLVVFDAYRYLNAIVAHPEAYGLQQVTEPCVFLGPAQDCSGFLFWDPVHPSTAGHAVLADLMREDFCGTADAGPGLRGRTGNQPPPLWRGACYGAR